ncbi:MAG: hypothetical protein QF858_00570 [Candidatus Pacebacteria bacterium]|jgi:hypothetical protein|nr:hypothetical protein [Candidatus Paceibacterota bacterium]|tara:strand:- start:1750 stop:1890 length:141 start_codon:yes stop_codon:yes gene_type:complete
MSDVNFEMIEQKDKRYWNFKELLVWVGLSLVGGAGIGMIISSFWGA